MIRSHKRSSLFCFTRNAFRDGEGGAGGSTPAAPAAPAAPAPAPVVPVPAPVTPAAAPAAVPAPVAPAPVPTPVVEPTGEQEPHWLPKRLESAKASGQKATLAALGVATVEEAKAKLAQLAVTETKSKTAEERLAALEARIPALEQTIKEQVDAELATLTETQQSAVAAIAGENASTTRVRDVIRALKPTWANMPAPPAAPKPVPAPASTSAATPAPAAQVPAVVDHLQVWEGLKETSPLSAVRYLEKHQQTIYAQIDARRKLPKSQ